MFIVTLEDGTNLKEGVEVKHWGEIPADAVVKAVTLTDYGQLAFTLRDYDYYVVAYHAKASISTEGGGVPAHPVVESQTLYAIQNHGIIKPDIQKIAAKVRAGIVDIGEVAKEGENHMMLQLRDKLDGDMRCRMEAVLTQLESTEVMSVSLGFQVKEFPRSEFKQAETGLRGGMPRATSPQVLEWVETQLLTPEK